MHDRILETIRVPHVRMDDALVTNFAHPRECGWLGLVLGVDWCPQRTVLDCRNAAAG
jgi:hypothetical protein